MSSITEARATAAEGLAVEDRRLQVAGIPTAVLEGGDGPPVVLLHGPIANGLHWLRVIPALTPRHRIVAPDLPGQGETAQTAGGTRDEVLEWLDALVEETCEGPAAVVGVTLGGAVATWYAAEHPERVDRLVLVDALGLAPFAPAPRFAAALNAFLAGPGGRRTTASGTSARSTSTRCGPQWARRGRRFARTRSRAWATRGRWRASAP